MPRKMDVSEADFSSLSFTGRGGYGDYGGYGGGHGGYGDYGNYVDPYVVLAALGFGVFLFNLIYNLLNRSARSIEVSDMNLPLQLSDRPEFFMNFLDNVTTSKDFEWNKVTSEDLRRNKLFAKSMHIGRKITDAVAKNPGTCSKALLCYLANDDVAWNRQPALLLRGVQLYIASLAKYFGQEDVAKYIDEMDKIEEKNKSCEEIKSDSNSCNENDLMSFF